MKIEESNFSLPEFSPFFLCTLYNYIFAASEKDQKYAKTVLLTLIILLLSFFSENTGKLQVNHIKVPEPFILGSSADLFCNYSWTDPGGAEKRPVYSIKWYKENREFFR